MASLTNNMCIDCDDFYGYNIDKRCSLCHIITNKDHPDNNKYYKNEHGKIKSVFNKKYPLIFLNNFTNSRKLPNNDKLFISLKNMFETGSFMKDNNFNLWLDCLKKTIYKGIDINQAIELSSIVNNSGYQNINEKWRIGHYICGLIIDWWNIRGKKISVVQCYYDVQINDDHDPRPNFNIKIKCAPLFDTKCNFKKTVNVNNNNEKYIIPCPNYGKCIENCRIEHNHRYNMCITNFFK
jgi:hypothetical protein